jgi:tRNA(Ser,Leu) C12 N-acetylase TAN1
MKFDLRKALEREMEIKARLNEMADTIEKEAREMNEAERLRRRSFCVSLKYWT